MIQQFNSNFSNVLFWRQTFVRGSVQMFLDHSVFKSKHLRSHVLMPFLNLGKIWINEIRSITRYIFSSCWFLYMKSAWSKYFRNLWNSAWVKTTPVTFHQVNGIWWKLITMKLICTSGITKIALKFFLDFFRQSA